jgi:hypothetical protein
MGRSTHSLSVRAPHLYFGIYEEIQRAMDAATANYRGGPSTCGMGYAEACGQSAFVGHNDLIAVPPLRL